MVEAFDEALADAGIDDKQIEAAWFWHRTSTRSTSAIRRIPAVDGAAAADIPVTRVENFCATGTEAFRGAAYAVASGAFDIALAIGVEKLKDTGYGGLPRAAKGTLQRPDGCRYGSAPGSFAQLAAGYRAQARRVEGGPEARDRRMSRGRATRTAPRTRRRICSKEVDHGNDPRTRR